MKLSKNFSLSEFTQSNTAISRGIDNTPSERVINSLKYLVSNLIQPLRDKWGEPIRINSGYRSEALNKAVGGVPTSQHVKGEASDLAVDGKAGDLLEVLEDSGLEFDQAILYRSQNFLHVSLKKEGNRKQIIIKK